MLTTVVVLAMFYDIPEFPERYIGKLYNKAKSFNKTNQTKFEYTPRLGTYIYWST